MQVAIVGRMNVGKSTLFNRLSTKTKAIIFNKPGVTRDNNFSPAQLGPLEFTIIDTPGIEKNIHQLDNFLLAPILKANALLFIVDGKIGITYEDIILANILRKHHNNIILVANKSEKDITLGSEYYELGFGHPIKISAEHGIGMMDLYEALVKFQDNNTFEKPNEKNIRIAIIGKPNSGKSTYINKLIDEERLVTSPIAGTTRDSIEIAWEYKGKTIELVDTAGIRRKSKIIDPIEQCSIKQSIKAINFAHVAILIIDAEEGISKQDLKVANIAINEGRIIILGINKWDLVELKNEYQTILKNLLKYNISEMQSVPIVYFSALDNKNLLEAIDKSVELYDTWNTNISTGQLNKWLQIALSEHNPPFFSKNKRIKIKYCLQTNNRPPKFKFFSNCPKDIPDSYKKYLTNSLKEYFNLKEIPIKINFTKSDNPYVK